MRTKAGSENQVWRVLRRVDEAIFPTMVPANSPPTSPRPEVRSAACFQSGRSFGTIVLWLVFGLNLAEFYALQSWLPTILTNLHYPLSTVALATSLTTIGGIVAAFAIGPAMDRLGAYGSLAVVYFAGVVFVALLGPAISAPSWVLLVAALLRRLLHQRRPEKRDRADRRSSIRRRSAPPGSAGPLGIGRLGGIGGPAVGRACCWAISSAQSRCSMRRRCRCCWRGFW